MTITISITKIAMTMIRRITIKSNNKNDNNYNNNNNMDVCFHLGLSRMWFGLPVFCAKAMFLAACQKDLPFDGNLDYKNNKRAWGLEKMILVIIKSFLKKNTKSMRHTKNKNEKN